MSKVCEVCGRGKMTGKQVSFSNKKYNRTYELNLQKTTIEVDGKPQTVKACTKCIKSAKKAQFDFLYAPFTGLFFVAR